MGLKLSTGIKANREAAPRKCSVFMMSVELLETLTDQPAPFDLDNPTAPFDLETFVADLPLDGRQLEDPKLAASKTIEMKSLVADLELDGDPLQAPQLSAHHDNMHVDEVAAPAFLRLKDPKLQQHRTRAEEVLLPKDASCLHLGARLGTSFARMVHGVLEADECAQLLTQAGRRMT